jgi:hypothetical protein
VKRGYSDELEILEGIYELFGKVTIVPVKIWGLPDEIRNFESKGAPLLSAWIGNAAWEALYDERGNPQAAELLIAGNVTSGHLSC